MPARAQRLLAISVLLLVPVAFGLKIAIPTGQQECVEQPIFEEEVEISKVLKLEVEGALEVLGPDGKPNFNSRRSVAVQVTDPKGRVLIDKKRIWQETDFVVGGTALGTYKLCVTNNGVSKADVSVDVSLFSVTHADTGNDEEDGGYDEEHLPPGMEPVSHMHLTQVHDLVLRISDQVKRVRGEQRYYRHRINRHLVTNKSMHTRTKTYWLVEALVLCLMTVTQLVTVRAMFRKHRPGKGIIGV